MDGLNNAKNGVQMVRITLWEDKIMQQNVPIISFINSMNDVCNHPVMTEVTPNKTLHLPNVFVRTLMLSSCITKNILLLMMYLIAHITQYTESLNTIHIPIRKLAADMGINLTGGRNYQSMVNMLQSAAGATVKLASYNAETEQIALFRECCFSADDNMVALRLGPKWQDVFLHIGGNKTVVHWGFLRQLSSTRAIWLYLVCSSAKEGGYVLQYKFDHLIRLCGQGADAVGEFTAHLIKAMYEINVKTDIDGKLFFVRKGHELVAVQISTKTKEREEMNNGGISAEAQRCASPKVTKADMRKAVVTSKAFRTAPGRLISVSDKHVRYREPLFSLMVDK